MPTVSQDVIVLPASQGRWVLLNVFSRTCLAVDAAGLSYLSKETPSDEVVSIWDIERFTNTDGLLSDPTRMVRNQDDWPEAMQVEPAAFMAALKDHFIVVDDPVEYRSRFGAKTSPLDRHNFGNFHVQLGQHLLLDRRVSPEDWWADQKFEPDYRTLKDTLYKAAEGQYLTAYISEKFDAGMTVLDLGCGPGYYARLIAETGADVLGVDPSASYVDAAANNTLANLRFEKFPLGEPGALAQIPDDSFDTVFISDALLFYFVAPAAVEKPDPAALFADVRRVLKDGGKLVSVEPHHTFWLAPWLGAEDHPFTVLSEYRNRNYLVTPTVSEFIKMFAAQGFAVLWMDEIYVDPDTTYLDKRTVAFTSEFPIGQIMELGLTSSL